MKPPTRAVVVKKAAGECQPGGVMSKIVKLWVTR